MPTTAAHAVRLAVQRAARDAPHSPLLLAVSGGLDSMALMHAMAETVRDRVCGVATFDHGTGAEARAAVEMVRAHAGARGIPVLVGGAGPVMSSGNGREAAWRDARWRFLREAADRRGALIVTAHTEDDQLETVLMRIMRGSGARGLAALAAETAVLRPLLTLRRATVASYARGIGLPWVEDSSNRSRAFFRNRVRHDLLPALRMVEPGLDEWLLSLCDRANLLRREVDAYVREHLRPEISATGRVIVRASELTTHDRESLAVLWGAIASSAGLALDHRGTRRVAAFTSMRPRAGRIPLSGGWCVEATRDTFILQREPARPGAEVVLPRRGSLSWGRFRFRVTIGGPQSSPWSAAVPGGMSLRIRAWQSGDRLAPAGGQPRRRVTRYLSEAGVQGADRAGWPVVVAGDEVVWIPGVRRSDAAAGRSGTPRRYYVCERIDG